MTQGVVSMSARQVPGRKTSSKALFLMSTASAMMPAMSVTSTGDVVVPTSLAKEVNEFMALQGTSSPQRRIPSMAATLAGGRVGGLSRYEKQKVRKVHRFLRAHRSLEEREKLRTVSHLNTRLPSVLQKFNSNLELLNTTDGFRKAYLIDKPRAAKLYSALNEARAEILKQEQPILTKMTTFNWIANAELWDHELQETKRRTEKAKTNHTTEAYGGHNQIFNAVINPISKDGEAWKKAVAMFNQTLDAHAKRNVEISGRLLATMSRAEKKKYRMVSESRFTQMYNQIFRDFKTGKLRRNTFFRWIKSQLDNKTRVEAEMDQLAASVGILNAYIRVLDPNNVHVINAMNKNKVAEPVYRSVLHTMAKELETTVRAEGLTLQALLKNSLNAALSQEEPMYPKLVKSTHEAFNAGVAQDGTTVENSPEAWLLYNPTDFFKHLNAGKLGKKNLVSRIFAAEGEKSKLGKVENAEVFDPVLVGAILKAHEALEQDTTGDDGSVMSTVGTSLAL